MTVQELIELLQKVEDKTKEIVYDDQGFGRTLNDVIEYVYGVELS